MVKLREVQNMFWGVTLDGGKRYTQTVERSFHLSMAALESGTEPKNCKDKVVSVMIQHEKAEFVMCTLEFGKLFQQPLDLNFTEGEEVTFFLNGTGVVHLTGYLVEEGQYDDDDMDLSEMSEGETEDSDEEAPQLLGLGDLDEEDDDDSNDEDFQMAKRKASKKRKGDSDSVVKKKKTKIFADSDEEEESDSDEEEESDSDDEVLDEETLRRILADGEDFEEEEEEEEEVSEEEKKPVKSSKVKQSIASKRASEKKNGSQNGLDSTPSTEEKKKKKKKKKKKNKNKEQEQDSQNNTEKSPSSQQKVSPEPSIRTVEGGVTVVDLKVGHGLVAKSGRHAHVYYVGTLAQNQKQFDSLKAGRPFKFKLGKGDVIQGWDTGVIGMKVGGKRKLVIPPAMGYGKIRQGPIPPNSTLVFEVELKAVS